jgi:crossover junction endodeoxyribonuclease RusA
MSSISFTVEGEPVAKERPRTMTDTGGRTRTITPSKTLEHEAAIGWAFKAKYPGHEPWTGDVRLVVEFHTRSKSKDLDNMLKTVMDALNGVVWADDRQIWHITAEVKRLQAWQREAWTHIYAREVSSGEEEAESPRDLPVL